MANQNYSKNSFLDDYVGVDELIAQMNEKYPQGVLISEVIDFGENHVVFRTTFYEDKESPAKCTGHSRLDKSPNNPHWFEKAETKSRGRCLRVLLSAGVTKEEMEDVDMSATPQQTVEPVVAQVNKNSAITALQEIQQSVRGGELLALINDSLGEAELKQVNTLTDAKEYLESLGGADSVLFANTIKQKSANI